MENRRALHKELSSKTKELHNLKEILSDTIWHCNQDLLHKSIYILLELINNTQSNNKFIVDNEIIDKDLPFHLQFNKTYHYLFTLSIVLGLITNLIWRRDIEYEHFISDTFLVSITIFTAISIAQQFFQRNFREKLSHEYREIIRGSFRKLQEGEKKKNELDSNQAVEIGDDGEILNSNGESAELSIDDLLSGQLNLEQ